MPFIFKRLEIPDVLLIEPLIFKDARGMFAEIYKFSDFSQYGITNQITKINYSKSNYGKWGSEILSSENMKMLYIPVLSEKDSRHPLFKYADNNFEFYKNK